MNTFAFEHTGEIDPVRYTRGKPTELKLAGRQSQFQALLAPMHQRLYRFVRHSLHNAQDAEDVTQEALLRAWAHFETFDAQRSFDAWVFRIAGNLIVDHQRRKRRRSELPLDAPILHEDGGESAYHSIFSDSTGDPEACLMAREASEELDKAVGSQPPNYLAVLLLVAEHYSYEQISRTLDCSLGTVRSRVHRARTQLRRDLKERLSRV